MLVHNLRFSLSNWPSPVTITFYTCFCSQNRMSLWDESWTARGVDIFFLSISLPLPLSLTHTICLSHSLSHSLSLLDTGAVEVNTFTICWTVTNICFYQLTLMIAQTIVAKISITNKNKNYIFCQWNNF